MAGDVNKASVWTNADCWIGISDSPTMPTDVATPIDEESFGLVGLLSGDDGFQESRDEDTDDKYAWGSILVRTTHSHHKRTIKFTALEDNEYTLRLVNPGSKRTTTGGITKTSVIVPKYGKFPMVFETREGITVKRKLCDSCEVQEVGDITEAEAELTMYEITVVIYPDADGHLWDELKGDVPEDDDEGGNPSP